MIRHLGTLILLASLIPFAFYVRSVHRRYCGRGQWWVSGVDEVIRRRRE